MTHNPPADDEPTTETPSIPEVEPLLEDAHQLVEEYTARLKTIVKNPTQSDAIVVLSSPGEEDVIFTDEGDIVRIPHEQTCPVCNDDERYTPGRGEGHKTSYRRRREAACTHREAVLNAVSLRNEPDACPECGSFQLRERRLHHHGQWVMSSYSCRGCGADRGTQ